MKASLRIGFLVALMMASCEQNGSDRSYDEPSTCEGVGLTTCEEDCVDPSRDNRHCGRCDFPCNAAGGFTCQESRCTCMGGTAPCSDACDSDPDCPGSSVCLEGRCVPVECTGSIHFADSVLESVVRDLV